LRTPVFWKAPAADRWRKISEQRPALPANRIGRSIDISDSETRITPNFSQNFGLPKKLLLVSRHNRALRISRANWPPPLSMASKV
jgi:hypothetical protein